MTALHRGLKRVAAWQLLVASIVLVGVVEAIHAGYRLSWPVHLGGYVLMMGVVTAGIHVMYNALFREAIARENALSEKEKEYHVLTTIQAVINDSLKLSDFLERVLDGVIEVTWAERAEISLWDGQMDTLTAHVFRGQLPGIGPDDSGARLDEEIPRMVARRKDLLVICRSADEHHFVRTRLKEMGVQTYAGVPLISKGRLAGVISMMSSRSVPLTEHGRKLLVTLGHHISTGIENAEQLSGIRETSVMDERRRIARELHDGPAQVLGFVHLRLGELEGATSVVSDPAVKEEILRMKELVADAYEEVRHSILGLRMDPRGFGLIPWLAEYLRRYSEQTGIDVQLQLSHEGATRIGASEEVHLFGIIREALANIRKHSDAVAAAIVFDARDNEARITIEDDGRGFDVDTTAQRLGSSFGLQSMKERAELMGGSLTVTSRPGAGTRLLVRFPLKEREEA